VEGILSLIPSNPYGHVIWSSFLTLKILLWCARKLP